MTIDMLAATMFRHEGARFAPGDPPPVDRPILPAEMPEADGDATQPASLWSVLTRSLRAAPRPAVAAAP